MAETVRVKGLVELQKFLDELPVKMEKNIMRGALRAGMKPIKEEAQLQVAVVSGALRDGLKISTRSKGGTVMARLRATGRHRFIAHIIEFTGAKAHLIRINTAKALYFGGNFSEEIVHPGFMAKPFMRPALDARAQQAVIAAGTYIKDRLATKNGLDTSGVVIEGDE